MISGRRSLAGIDRVLTTRVIWPAIRTRASGAERVVPILMYHGINRQLDSRRAPYFRTVTSPETFSAHVRLLDAAGFRSVSLTEALAWLESPGETQGAEIPVVITFDDGFADFYTDAFPALQTAGFTATVFLSSAYLGGRFPTGAPCLSAAQVKELSRHGIEFGSHSVTHAELVKQSRADLERELTESKASIESILGKEVTLFSFPYRFPEEQKQFVEYLHERLVMNGYLAGVTTKVGRATKGQDVMFLPRLPINDCDDEEFLMAKLGGAYDWVGRVQRAYKASRARLNRSHVWTRF